MIEFAFNSILRLKRFVKNNNDGSKVYANEEFVACYKEEKQALVSTQTGEQININNIYYTTTEIKDNDLINDEKVKDVAHLSMLGCDYYRSIT